MPAVSTVLAPNSNRPPLVMVHGSANSALVWSYWQREIAALGWSSHAIDLRGHGRSGAGDLSRTSMLDYAADVRSVVRELGVPPVVVGWSMGGLIALMVAAEGAVNACVALAPSTPSRERDASVVLREGQFGPEEYGITSQDLEDQPDMPDLNREERSLALESLSRESRLARDERRAGIVVEPLPCPLLILTGTADTQWPREKYDGLWLDAEHHSVEGASHWGLVLNARAVAGAAPVVSRWLGG